MSLLLVFFAISGMVVFFFVKVWRALTHRQEPGIQASGKHNLQNQSEKSKEQHRKGPKDKTEKRVQFCISALPRADESSVSEFVKPSTCDAISAPDQNPGIIPQTIQTGIKHKLLIGMASNLLAMASNLRVMASNLRGMASNLRGMASNLRAMASNLRVMASNLRAMASKLRAMADGLQPTSDGLQPKSDGLQPKRDGFQPKRDGFQPKSDGLQPKSDGLQPKSDGLQAKSDGRWPPTY